MSDQSGPPASNDWHDRKRAERQARRKERRAMRGWGGAGIGGVILVLLGVIFLLRNFGMPLPENWWAIFLFIPGVGLLIGAWSKREREGGEFSPGVLAMGASGFILLALGVSFLLGANWGKFWPVILILLGVAALFGNYRRR